MGAAETLSAEKREQILAGAAAIFAQDGYEGASMSRIAAQARVSKGTLYNHFSGKADLFGAYVRHTCLLGLVDLFDSIENDDPASSLAAIGRSMVGLALSPIGQTIYRVVVSEAAKFPELARIYYQAGPALAIDSLANWLARQSGAGRLTVPDPTFAAEQFFALCQTRYVLQCKLHLLSEPSAEELDRVIQAAVRMFLRSYAATT